MRRLFSVSADEADSQVSLEAVQRLEVGCTGEGSFVRHNKVAVHNIVTSDCPFSGWEKSCRMLQRTLTMCLCLWFYQQARTQPKKTSENDNQQYLLSSSPWIQRSNEETPKLPRPQHCSTLWSVCRRQVSTTNSRCTNYIKPKITTHWICLGKITSKSLHPRCDETSSECGCYTVVSGSRMVYRYTRSHLRQTLVGSNTKQV